MPSTFVPRYPWDCAVHTLIAGVLVPRFRSAVSWCSTTVSSFVIGTSRWPKFVRADDQLVNITALLPQKSTSEGSAVYESLLLVSPHLSVQRGAEPAPCGPYAACSNLYTIL
jgi:hypothetical protein